MPNCEMAAAGMSDRQREVVAKAVTANRACVLTSDDTAAVLADQSAVVEPIVAGRIGRNEKCPCGSGVKFKRCHGK